MFFIFFFILKISLPISLPQFTVTHLPRFTLLQILSTMLWTFTYFIYVVENLYVIILHNNTGSTNIPQLV